MKSKLLLLLLLLIVTIATASAFFLRLSVLGLQKNVKVKCNYMAYACGDCFPQYQVNAVWPASLGGKLIEQDIGIEFANASIEKQFKKKTGSYSISYTYYLTGTLLYSMSRRCYVLRVNKYSVKNKKNEKGISLLQNR